ncbi:lasso peptide biosynthesis B2 protein [Sphingomonas flavescens]|uniref:lasso peptide biosynthesis B2 protein n=1 Tax=Sphingomonas flavescens TaxID=3132797 RepID=UPI003B2101DA
MTAARKGAVRRLIERSGRDNLLLAEAVVHLLRAWSAVRFLPFRWAVTSGSARVGKKPSADADRLAWAVSAAGAHVPWRAVCLEQGLALQRMLRRRGVDARLQYGIGHSNAGELQAHVWVSVGDRIVIGGEQAPDFKCVATYPEKQIGPSQ